MRVRKFTADTALIIASGLALGGFGAALVLWGNPANSGICVSCFMENLSGSLGLHNNLRMAVLRPELAGFAAGSLLSAFLGRELRPRSGAYPLFAFILGIFLIVGSSVFMGCPIKMMLRLGAGDLTAVAGLIGLAAGVWAGIKYYRAGLDMGELQSGTGIFQSMFVPLMFLLLLLLSIGGFLISGTTGPAAQKAPFAIALGAGIIIGALAQRSRFCVTGSFSNLFLARDLSLMNGLAALFIAALAVNAASGLFHLGIPDQPGSHPDHLWNFLSMGLVGFASVLAGGCPFRQVVLTGEGSVDAGMAVFGMMIGGGLVHQWGIASTSAGPTAFGKAAVLLGLAFCLGIARFYRRA